MKELPGKIKTFFKSLGENVKEISAKTIERIKNDKKFRIIFITVCAVILALIIGLIIWAAIRDNDTAEEPVKNDNIEITDVATPTPLPTPTPSPTPTPEPTPTPTPSPTPTPNLHIGETRSYLTGEWVAEEIVKERPYCIMFNNIGVANPQSGIGDAKILYEALTESGITRLMGVFEGLNDESSCKDRIGSVRSARHYFASFADEYDSIFIHFGETTYAEKRIKKLKLDHLEGIYWIGDTVYYRDKNIPSPHNAFASLKGIHEGIAKMKIRTQHEDGYTPNHFRFNEDVVVPAGTQLDENNTEKVSENVTDALNITLPYSNYMTATLDYDEESGLYTRHEFGGVHIDYNTGEPLRFTNVIIQIVHEFDKDKNGYQDMDITDASGKGYYISKGKCVPITWKKNEKNRTMFYYDENGNVLKINEGRTFISIFPDFRLGKLMIEGNAETEAVQ